MGEIRLKGLTFKAYHGYYDEEREIGNHFEVDVLIRADFTRARKSDHLEDTIDYSAVYKVIMSHMQGSAKLLEFVAGNICDQLLNDFSTIEEVRVRLSKLNPPIGGPCEAAEVTVTGSR